MSDYLSDNRHATRWIAPDIHGLLSGADLVSDARGDRPSGAWQSRDRLSPKAEGSTTMNVGSAESYNGVMFMTDGSDGETATDEATRNWIVEVLPGSTASFGESPDHHGIAVPLWLKWCQIARRQGVLAADARAPDSHIDAMSAKLAHINPPPEDGWVPRDVSELEHSMTAIVAAALAIDGFYGSVKSIVSPPEMRAARARKILELLKLGFAIGKESRRWMSDLDWLFDLRDRAVHHAEDLAPYVLVRQTELTDVVGARESYELSAVNAKRAAAISVEVLVTCLSKPKSATAEWCESRRPAAEVLRGMVD